jgi:dual-specificity kinase
VQNYHLNGPIANGSSRLTGSHYNQYPANPASAPTTDLRRTATINSRQTNPTQLPSIHSSPPSSDMSGSAQTGRRVDWNEFYRNGIPEEIIVIDDDTPPRTLQPHAVQKPSLTNGTSRPVEKKRKTAAAPYDPVYNPQPSYSTTQTPYYENSSSNNNTASTDRTTSAYITTAATSLGSQISNGTYHAPIEDGVVGQKRKRTRAAAAEEAQGAKRRELDRQSPLSIHYVPPSKPIIKAKEVPVELITEVYDDAQIHGKSLAHTEQKSYHKDKKCDDDDGHYIVTPDADLTSRCMSHHFSLTSLSLIFPDQIIRLLGQGTFGKVVEAFDRQKGTRCAIKIIRSVQKYRDASRIELRVLSTLAQNDRHNRNKCIHLRQCFDFRNHICIVTDLYGQSVFDFLKTNNFTPFPSTHIQTFARQLLTSVACKSLLPLLFPST